MSNESDESPNQAIADFLLELADFEQNIGRNVFKANAYRKAANVVAKLKVKIQSGNEVLFTF